jgi:ketosteroid isomerase-like protein
MPAALWNPSGARSGRHWLEPEELRVTERAAAERIVRELHKARVNGDLLGLCSLFADDGRFEIAGASADKPIAIRAHGLAEFKPWLAMMTKVFRLSDYHLISLVIEGPRIAAHWRVNIFSKVTGVTVPTELVDLIELSDNRIRSYNEFFVPR